jgi:hypothetical protein
MHRRGSGRGGRGRGARQRRARAETRQRRARSRADAGGARVVGVLDELPERGLVASPGERRVTAAAGEFVECGDGGRVLLCPSVGGKENDLIHLWYRLLLRTGTKPLVPVRNRNRYERYFRKFFRAFNLSY